MIGMQTLINARMAGHRPSDVWLVCLDTEPRYGTFTHPDAQLELRANGKWVGHPEIHILDHENAATLDLRAVIGLVVHVCSLTRERGILVLNRAVEFQPAKALASGAWGLVGWRADLGFRELVQ